MLQNINFDDYDTVHELFEARVEKNPDDIAVIFDNMEISYGNLNKRSNKLARYLVSRGVSSEKVVGVMMERSIDFVVAVFAILKAGGAYLAINPNYPEKRQLTMMEDSNVRLLLTKEAYIQKSSYTSLQNINFNNSNLICTKTRAQIKDFNSVPIPNRGLIDYEKYSEHINLASVTNSITLQGTRGCPYQCAYCHKIWPKSHVVRTAENIFNEVMINYKIGFRRFSFIDDIFNFDVENSKRFLNMLIDSGLDIQIFFPNGVRGDILTKDYIDLLIKAGTRSIGFALETGSPRLQKLIRKNLNIEKLRENIEYIAMTYPHVVLDLFTMHGFPTETKEEAMMTLDFIKSIKWIDFPYVFILKIYPDTDMEIIARDNGVSKEDIERSMDLMYHELPYTLPFNKSFTQKYQADFLNDYFLSQERLKAVLPREMNLYSESELIQRYNSYLPVHIETFDDILNLANLTREDFKDYEFRPEHYGKVDNYLELAKQYFPVQKPDNDALRILFLDLSQYFSSDSNDIILQVEAPLGHMYILTYLNEQFGSKVYGKLAKASIDFDSYDELRKLIVDFNPDIIGIRTLTYWKNDFHKTVSYIRHWGFDVPIVTGGPYATSSYSSILNDGNVDLVALGEGELTITELIGEMLKNNKKLPDESVLERIDGIAFVKKRKENALEHSREIVMMDRMETILDRYDDSNPKTITDRNSLMYVIYTSGTTGIPKGIMMEHKNIMNLMKHEFMNLDLGFEGKVMQFADICFDISYQEIFSTLISGGKLYVVTDSAKTNIFKLFEYIEKNRIESVFLPTAYINMITSSKKYIDKFPSCVKNLAVAGEQLIINPQLEAFLKNSKLSLHNHYGVSETHVVTMFTINNDDISYKPMIGKPILNTNIYIMDSEMQIVKDGEIGELYVSGDCVGRGYINRPKETATYFMTHPSSENIRMYKTGDLGRYEKNGEIEFFGRKDRQIKIRGYRIELEEIENVLRSFESIDDALIVDIDDEQFGKRLIAYVKSSENINSDYIKMDLEKQLPEYMIPETVIVLEKFPLKLNGKIDKEALPSLEDLFNTYENIILPTNELEEKILSIWKEIVGIEHLGIDSNFFECGGDSISCTQLLSMIYIEFGVEIELEYFFENPTISSISKVIAASNAT